MEADSTEVDGEGGQWRRGKGAGGRRAGQSSQIHPGAAVKRGRAMAKMVKGRERGCWV